MVRAKLARMEVIMTNINCTADCIYQKEGKCTYSLIFCKTITPNSNCVYYSKIKSYN